MPLSSGLLRANRNYRHLWIGQVVSEMGDHFNNIAVLALAFGYEKPGLVVTGIMLARTLPAMFAGPLAGVVLDRFDRKRVMIASDLARAVIAAGFIGVTLGHQTWLLYPLSALLMLCTPFFSAGRSAILPRIAAAAELNAAAATTQTTGWVTSLIGSLAAGSTVAAFGYEWAFVLNSASFVYSAWAISRLRTPEGHFRPLLTGEEARRPSGHHPFAEYAAGLRYMREHPLILALAVVNFGWATGGGAAQVLFSMFGASVFHRGAAGIGLLYAGASVGLILGGALAHSISGRLSFAAYRRTIAICYVVHGGSYVMFALAPAFWGAVTFIGLSRAAVAVSSVLNFAQLLRSVTDEYRGRVFATMDTITWTTMLLSTMGAGLATLHLGPRAIGVWSGVLSSLTAVYWIAAHRAGKLREAEPAPGPPLAA